MTLMTICNKYDKSLCQLFIRKLRESVKKQKDTKNTFKNLKYLMKKQEKFEITKIKIKCYKHKDVTVKWKLCKDGYKRNIEKRKILIKSE